MDLGNQKYKLLHKKLGLCVDCSEPAIPFEIRCAKHNWNLRQQNKRWCKNNSVKYNKIGREQKQQYRETNRCMRCSAPLDSDADMGYVTCVNCRINS